MNAILDTPIQVRLALLFAVGICVGTLVNLAVYTLSWEARLVSPWSRPSHHAPPRQWQDRIPIFGWLGLRREVEIHGHGFWVRPMFIEALCGFGLAALYWWEVDRAGLLPREQLAGLLVPGDLGPRLPAGVVAVLHGQFFVHGFLLWLMLVASLIDADEKIIPDTITVPGTLLGLAAAAACPWSMLPVVGGGQLDFLRLTAPSAWPGWLEGYPQPWSVLVGLGCWWLWCFALMPRTWYTRHGVFRAIALAVARLRRETSTWRTGLMGLVGTVAVAGVWLFAGPWWEGLLTALVGMAAGGGIVWAVRIIGTRVLGREAMGFGDVTLMAMIGAFLGWQACLMVFFLAPFAGLIVGVLNLVLRRDHEIPYGPFLCMAAAFVVVRWPSLWDWTLPYFQLGWVVPIMVAGCMALMAVLLGVIQVIKGLFRAARPG